jgi:hypothetical protein
MKVSWERKPSKCKITSCAEPDLLQLSGLFGHGHELLSGIDAVIPH